jgi:hypothetical protein
MDIAPLLACGPSGPIVFIILGVVGGGGLLCLGSIVTGIVLLCKRKTLGLWLIFLPFLLVAGIMGWLQSI